MVFTVVWVIGVGVYTYNEWPQYTMPPGTAADGTIDLNAWEAGAKGGVRSMSFADVNAANREVVWQHLKMASGNAVFVSAVLFLIGSAPLWIGRGFRKT
jgi:hypothetical protein